MMMMKKIIILLAVLACGVGEVKAADLYINTDWVTWWNALRVYAWNSDTNENNKWSPAEASDGFIGTTVTRFGRSWYKYSMGSYNRAIVQFYNSSDLSKVWDATYDIEMGSEDRYILIYSTVDKTEDDGLKKHSYDYIAAPIIRNNYDNNWNSDKEALSNMVAVDDNTLTYTLTKSQVETITDDSFRFRIYNFRNQIYPTSSAAEISIAGSTSSYNNDETTINNYFYVSKPTYDYEKIVITAAYNTSTSTWTISADAYVSPSLSYEVATYSVAAPLDFSQATGVKGYYASDADASKVTFTKIDGACAANTGLVLAREGSDPISIPVAASGTDYTLSNKLKAGTGASVNSDGSTNRYVLARNNSTGDIHFAKLASSKEIAVGKAYLELPASPSPAPSLSIFFDDAAGGTTAIDAVKSAEPAVTDGAYYNLAGQRVANPTKGLYIVNGRKVVVK